MHACCTVWHCLAAAAACNRQHLQSLKQYNQEQLRQKQRHQPVGGMRRVPGNSCNPSNSSVPATPPPPMLVLPPLLTSATPLLLICCFCCCCGCCFSGGCARWAAPQGGGVQGRHIWCRGAQGAAAHRGGLCHLQRGGAAAGGAGRRHRPVPLRLRLLLLGVWMSRGNSAGRRHRSV